MLKTSHNYCVLTVFSMVLLLGCGPTPNSSSLNSTSTTQDSPSLIPGAPHTEKGICSNLDFLGFSWPSNMFEFEKEGLEIALNISGSFEGPDGWRNLTNDFDGQGLSMGLMNQTLGTGSLQPLLLKMRNQHRTKLEGLFQADHLQSLLAMLSEFENSLAAHSSSETLSPLDVDGEATAASDVSTLSSVDWARKTIYDSPGTFNPIWKQELLNLAGSTEYVALQIDAAWELHLRALQLHRMMAVYELRTYLLMFDIVVQNGNLKPEDETAYKIYVKQNPRASATQRLQKIIELRLRWVRPRFQNDVRLRKMSIINGGGVVHGVSRQYEKEFCFNGRQAFPRQPTPLP